MWGLDSERIFYLTISLIFMSIVGVLYAERIAFHRNVSNATLIDVENHEYFGLSEFLFSSKKISLRTERGVIDFCISTDAPINTNTKIEKLRIGVATGMLIEGNIAGLATGVVLLDWKTHIAVLTLLFWILPAFRSSVFLFFAAMIQGFVALDFLALAVCQY